MKIQFAFLSLLLATAHAGHEPKGLRGRSGDDQDVDLLGLGYTAVPNGSSATIKCGSGSQCCATGQFYGSINYGYSSIGGGGGCAGTTYNNASTGTCTSSSCTISCDGTCNVVVKAGSGGGGVGGGGGGGYGPYGGGGGYSGASGYMPNWPTHMGAGGMGGGSGGMPGMPGYRGGGGGGGAGGGGGGGGGGWSGNGGGYNWRKWLPNGGNGGFGGGGGGGFGGGGGGDDLKCSERQASNCGHTVCTYTDSGCVPNSEYVGVMDEFGKSLRCFLMCTQMIKTFTPSIN